MGGLPDALFVIDVDHEAIAIKEAKNLGAYSLPARIASAIAEAYRVTARIASSLPGIT
jgi:hypothetical protein